MNQQQPLLNKLYQLALVETAESDPQALIRSTLLALLHHTGCPCGLFVSGIGQAEDQLKVEAASGQREMVAQVGQPLPMAKALLGDRPGWTGQSELFQGRIPGSEGFSCMAFLPVDGDGFLLFAASPSQLDVALIEALEPVLQAFAQRLQVRRAYRGLQQLARVNGAMEPVMNPELTATPAATEQQADVRVLVVEDNPVNQATLRQQLMQLGYQVDVVPHGRAALAVWDAGVYGCIVTRCDMPLMSGFELAEAIRAAETDADSRMPIIAIAAHGDELAAQRCLDCGMDECLVKPVDVQHLADVLGRWVRGAVAPSHPPQQSSDEPLPAFDPDVLSRLVRGDMQLQQRMLETYLKTTLTSIDEINQALAQQDLAAVEFVAHRLKSGTRAVGGSAMADACQAIEQSARAGRADGLAELSAQLQRQWQYLESQLSSALQTQTPAADSTPVSLPTAQLKMVQVLLLEDDPFMAQQIEGQLIGLGVGQVVCCKEGNAALRVLDQGARFNVILCDLNMPGMDGIEFLRHVAERGFDGGVALISGEGGRVLESAGKLAGAHRLNILATLEKPVLPERLLELLQHTTVEQTKRFGGGSFEQLSVEEVQVGILSDELIVFFQPKVDSVSRRVVGVEALARWQHPQRGLIGPGAFIPVAEEHGLINALTDSVFAKSMQWGGQWLAQGLDLKVAVNLSMDSLGRLDLPEFLMSQVAAGGMDPGKVVLEITESRLMDNLTAVLEVLTRLRLRGIELSIDDFGTGYSTMEQLKRIPFGELKIDRAFVNGAAHDNAARAILESSVSLAKKLGMRLVAEGVETQEDWDQVAALGCDMVQGYFVAKPMPADQLADWVRQWHQQL